MNPCSNTGSKPTTNNPSHFSFIKDQPCKPMPSVTHVASNRNSMKTRQLFGKKEMSSLSVSSTEQQTLAQSFRSLPAKRQPLRAERRLLRLQAISLPQTCSYGQIRS